MPLHIDDDTLITHQGLVTYSTIMAQSQTLHRFLFWSTRDHCNLAMWHVAASGRQQSHTNARIHSGVTMGRM